MAHANGRPIEVTEAKAPADRYEIAYQREVANTPDIDLTPRNSATTASTW
ncbi:hypothetical protein [Nonomuraea sp. NPDC050540]